MREGGTTHAQICSCSATPFLQGGNYLILKNSLQTSVEDGSKDTASKETCGAFRTRGQDNEMKKIKDVPGFVSP